MGLFRRKRYDENDIYEDDRRMPEPTPQYGPTLEEEEEERRQREEWRELYDDY